MSLFHRLTIAAIERQTPQAVAITFTIPETLREYYHYRPGQYLTLKAHINNEELRRCYSICAAPRDDQLQIGVKAIHQGRFSHYLNQQLKPGDKLDVMPPQGQFGYQPQPAQRGHYLAIAAGSGITPILSIINATLQTEADSQFTLLYGNKNSRSVMFKESLADLKDCFAHRFQLIYLFSQEVQDSPLLSGRIDKARFLALTRQLIRPDEFNQAFLCGPQPMIEEIENALLHCGMVKSQIHSERFQLAGQRLRPGLSQHTDDIQVEIHVDGRTISINMQPQDNSILDAALRQGADLPYACKGGVCATCKCKLKSGEVDMGVNYSLEPDQLAAGYILSCQSWPKSAGVVLDFDV